MYPPGPGFPLHLTAKRYWLPTFQADHPDALTLIFLHATSFHKETWEPTIDRLFQLASTDNNQHVKIREAWCLDCPNHGAAAELNERVLLEPEYFLNCERFQWLGGMIITRASYLREIRPGGASFLICWTGAWRQGGLYAAQPGRNRALARRSGNVSAEPPSVLASELSAEHRAG